MSIEIRLLVFAKAPVPGQVKTRLIPSISPADAARLHTQLIHRTLRLVRQFAKCRVQLWCSPAPDHPVFEACAREFGVTLHTQSGKNLGQRMSYAMDDAITSNSYAVLIGCDCPVLTLEDLDSTVGALRRGYDSVLGPAEDGGYVLIGLRQPVPEIFTGIQWGTSSVLEETRSRMDQLGLSCLELPIRWDLDRPSDLERFRKLPDSGIST